MPLESCTQSLCDLALQFGEDDDEGGGGGMVRAVRLSCQSGCWERYLCEEHSCRSW